MTNDENSEEKLTQINTHTTDNQKRIQQIEQSRTWITEALLSLMKEKPFHEISISEVTERADLSRRTFYRHFLSLEDVVKSYILKLCNECYSLCHTKRTTQSPILFPENLYTFFIFWEKHLDFLKSIQNTSVSFSPESYLFDLFYEKSTEVSLELDTPFNRQVLSVTGAGLWSMLMNWARQEEPDTPQEMALNYRRIITTSYNYYHE